MTQELKVAGMTCGHCVRAVTLAIQARDPQAKVQVDLPAGLVRADTTLDRAALTALVTAEGYAVTG
ncbi:heavy-metal-associated domain-containing protein [Falsiroseomonas sp.]|uniref:heavy-metal-associated domain-containing protein n=1 Tax=Falsiroseomonas sp. TaxID=2870721 RepID=UPI00271E2837|nr:heavy-metal-associated domain-containing protein [Falsiroseomonas sp.]MDO9503005.1 heavy-metal-associated domain-containing protein [Falsiroseomonas sp.]